MEDMSAKMQDMPSAAAATSSGPTKNGGHSKAKAPMAPPVNSSIASTSSGATRLNKSNKGALKEAVDAVVNSFAKHTQGYGRGK